MNYILTLLLGHVLGDFYFQSNQMASDKEKLLVKHVLVYTVILTVGYMMNTHDILSIFIFAAIIFISHLSIDKIMMLIKTKLNIKGDTYLNDLLLFMLDQALHFVVLCFVYQLNPLGKNAIHYENDLFLITVLFLYAIMPASILVDKILNLILRNPEINGFKLDEGTIIGILERMLTILLGVTGNISGIAVLVAAKTMVRYGQFNDENDFKVKYLIGTLASILIGVALYLCFYII